MALDIDKYCGKEEKKDFKQKSKKQNNIKQFVLKYGRAILDFSFLFWSVIIILAFVLLLILTIISFVLGTGTSLITDSLYNSNTNILNSFILSVIIEIILFIIFMAINIWSHYMAYCIANISENLDLLVNPNNGI